MLQIQRPRKTFDFFLQALYDFDPIVLRLEIDG